MSQCTAVKVLSFCCEPLPHWPPNLEQLTTHLAGGRGAAKLASMRALLGSLRDLPRLATLRLWHLWEDEAVVLGEAASFQGLHALRELSVAFNAMPRSPCFAGLAAAAARGVHVTVCMSYILWTDTSRQALWAALAQCPLHTLKLEIACYASTPPSATEQQLLASICCTELALSVETDGSADSSLQLHALLGIRAEQLMCSLCLTQPHQAAVDWALLSSRAGIYTLQDHELRPILVTGCSGVLPDFGAAWALGLYQSTQIRGVPVHLFEPGPHNTRVWRNHAAVSSCLEHAIEWLDWTLWSKLHGAALRHRDMWLRSPRSNAHLQSSCHTHTHTHSTVASNDQLLRQGRLPELLSCSCQLLLGFILAVHKLKLKQH